MAVPKKRTSKSKKNIRKSNWKKEAKLERNKVFSLPTSKYNKRKLKRNKSKIFKKSMA